MSYVTTKFDVPHIFRYGSIDEENGETWQLFYRCATVFSVKIKRDNIAGTPFEREWRKYCVEDLSDWINQWRKLCDLTISHILPKLQELAPTNGRHWKTFQDYLEPHMYSLQLFKDASSGDAIAELIHGPLLSKCSLPYDLQPQPLSRLDIPVDLLRVQAADITILDHARDWRQQPEKAQITSTGESAALITAVCARRAVETGIVSNASLEAMSKMLEFHKVEQDINIPKPLALVTTEVPYESEAKIAGLLYFGVPEDAKRLANMTIEELKEAHSKELTEFWRGQVKSILDVLAANDVAHGFVHEYNIWIDSVTSAWLDSPRGVWEDPFQESDLERLDHVFDVWLREKIGEH